MPERLKDATVELGDRSPVPERGVAGCPVMNRDFSRPLEVGCHWQLAQELRETSPVFYNVHGEGYWVFTRHEAVRELYKTPEIFSSEAIMPWEPEPIYRFVPTQIDPPNHIKYRRIVNPWFSPRAVDRAEPGIRRICRRLVAQTAPSGRCDFVNEFALRLPTEAFLDFIGIDPSEAELFVPWVEDFFSGQGGDPAGREPMEKALAGIRAYWAAALDERRHDPAPRDGDLASHILNSTFDERPLTDVEMVDMLTVLVLAGLDTTRGELGYMFRHLALHPHDRQRLREEPEIIPYAVEETLRYYTIIFGDGRKVTRDVEFHGASLKKGDMVYGLVSAANRDPSAYERADEFVLDRKRNNHMGFANGPHRCLGMHLARCEMKVAVEEWLHVIPDFRIATDDVLLERGGGSMMALLSLPLEWDLAANEA
jgi:cytochrome P450